MDHGREHVAGVGVGAVVLFQRELVAGEEGAAAAVPPQELGRQLAHLDAELGPRLPLGGDQEATGIFIDPPLRAVGGDRRVDAGHQVGRGGLEVEVVQGVLAGDHPLFEVAPGDQVLLLPVGERPHRHRGRAGHRYGGRNRVIGEDQSVLPVRVLEVVEDPLVLHEPRDELEGGLVVLDAVLAGVVGGGQGILEVGEPQIGEDLLDDVRHGLVLEDLAVGGEIAHPQPGNQLGVIGREVLVRPGLHEAADETVDVARRAVGQQELDGRALAHDLGEVEVERLGLHAQAEVEQLRDPFLAVEAAEQELVRAEGRGDR